MNFLSIWFDKRDTELAISALSWMIAAATLRRVSSLGPRVDRAIPVIDRSIDGPIYCSLERFPFPLNRKTALRLCSVAFSRREPAFGSLENALERLPIRLNRKAALHDCFIAIS
jgi:hypothetical protein